MNTVRELLRAGRQDTVVFSQDFLDLVHSGELEFPVSARCTTLPSNRTIHALRMLEDVQAKPICVTFEKALYPTLWYYIPGDIEEGRLQEDCELLDKFFQTFRPLPEKVFQDYLHI